jgi:hypothetical protein
MEYLLKAVSTLMCLALVKGGFVSRSVIRVGSAQACVRVTCANSTYVWWYIK